MGTPPLLFNLDDSNNNKRICCANFKKERPLTYFVTSLSKKITLLIILNIQTILFAVFDGGVNVLDTCFIEATNLIAQINVKYTLNKTFKYSHLYIE